jgi:outer membrane protein OmpA-like peptidoglycan-associated protein
VPARTPDPNLLGIANGTVLRSYAPAALDEANDANLGNAAESVPVQLSATTKPPFTFVFELPGVATISAFGADLPEAPQGGTPANVAFAVSTTGANTGFTEAGTVTGETAASSKSLPVNVKARWVRVTANGALYRTVSATGTIAQPPAALNPAGIYVEEARPEKNGTLVTAGTRDTDDRARFAAVGSALTATECRSDRVVATYLGHLKGRTWDAVSAGNKDENANEAHTVVNDEATIISGTDHFGGPIVFMRTNEKPPFCMPRVTGSGPHHVLVLDQDPIPEFYPADSTTPLPGYTFSAIGAGMLDADALKDKEAVITRGVCNIPELLSAEQIALLLQWTAAGHKLLLGSGGCGEGSDFTWLPYPFRSAGSGPESTHPGLIQVEDNALGTNDRNDVAHFVDVTAFVKNENNRLASANSITTTDPHWCGHFFVSKTSNVNGFAQTYATDGNGILIYDGFSPLDGEYAPLQRLRQLELALPVRADLPCTQHVTSAFIIEPSQEITFVAGKAQAVHAEMQVLANQAWSGHATVSASGALPATVSPNAFDIAGGTQNLIVAINVPASQKPGVYTVNVSADNGTGKTAQASIVLTGTPGAAPLKKQVAAQKRIRIYGIHFDVDSAHIQPRSEPVIADIAQIMRETAGLRFQVEGHTDSDGGAAYNLGLSQRRAQAVVDSLVARHQIARTRLVAKGYGLTKPVAPNANAAGKALNRRVELLRLQ